MEIVSYAKFGLVKKKYKKEKKGGSFREQILALLANFIQQGETAKRPQTQGRNTGGL